MPTGAPETVMYGGQAVIEGVMMRGPERMAIAVRRADGQVSVSVQQLDPWARRWPALRLPIIRGFASMLENLSLGITALLYSANESAGEGEQIGRGQMTLSVVVAFAVATLVFVAGPTALISGLRDVLGNVVLLNLVEGLIRIGLLVGYILAISRLDDIRRVFQYHGAEHKVIHTHEAGQELAVAAARGRSTLHPRCGTSFLLFVAVISILLFSFLGWPNLLVRVVSRLALMPVVAGLAYEVIRFSGRSKSPLLALAISPGLALQRLTTREPDDSQLEVAIAAFDAAYAGPVPEVDGR